MLLNLLRRLYVFSDAIRIGIYGLWAIGQINSSHQKALVRNAVQWHRRNNCPIYYYDVRLPNGPLQWPGRSNNAHNSRRLH